MPAPLLDVRHLTVRFSSARGGRGVTIVDDVSLSVAAGRTLGIVGESGSGKTTLARAILRLIPPAAGQVLLDGEDVLTATRAQLRAMRPQMQMVFQDPFSSLNPRHSVEKIVGEALLVHRVGDRTSRRDRTADMLTRVGLSNDFLGRYPHELSGGQRQRVAIARALILRPKLVICDEPVSALDVSIQSQILNLLRDLQDEYGVAYVFVGHHLGVVRHISHQIAVMQRGRVVERGAADQLFERPEHSYTQKLVSSVLEAAVPGQ